MCRWPSGCLAMIFKPSSRIFVLPTELEVPLAKPMDSTGGEIVLDQRRQPTVRALFYESDAAIGAAKPALVEQPRQVVPIVRFSISNHWINMLLITILKWILSTQLSKWWHQDATCVQLILTPLIILLPLHRHIKNIWSSHVVENSTSLLVFQMAWHSVQENSQNSSSLYTQLSSCDDFMQIVRDKLECLQFIPDEELRIQYKDDEDTFVNLRFGDSFHDA